MPLYTQRIHRSIGPFTDLTFFPPLSSICTRHHMPKLTSLERTYHPFTMKILLSRPSQHSGSMQPQRSTSQPADGSILSTLRTDFPELFQLFRTGTTGSKSTSGTPGSRGHNELSTQFPRAWSDPVSSLRKVGISGWLTPLSSILIWRTTKMEHFHSMDSSPTGHLVRIDAAISHS